MNSGRTRREFLAGLGSLSIGFALFPAAPVNAASSGQLPGDLRHYPHLESWLRINADRTVTLLVGKVELGQGILTVLCQICADELDVDFSRVKIISGDTAVVPNEGTTAGSFSTPECGTAVRYAAAEARDRLLTLAAAQLQTPKEKLTVRDGVVHAGNQATSYWDVVAGLNLKAEISGNARPKAAGEHVYVGKPVPRIDIPRKVFGEEIFIQDLRLPGMVHGRPVRPPCHNATLVSVDEHAVAQIPGVLKIVRDGSFLGVIASDEYAAVQAADKLAQTAKWSVKDALDLDEAKLHDWLLNTKSSQTEILNKGNLLPRAIAGTVRRIYHRPYLMHGSIGTSTAIATATSDGHFTIWTHSQSVFDTGAAVARMLGVDPSKVHCEHHQGSGCYGHNAADDVVADAALLARAFPGRPVRVQWSRHDEHKWEPYGAAMTVETVASVDANGNIINWSLDLWSVPHGTRPGGKPGNLLAAGMLEKPFPRPIPHDGGPPNYAAARNAIALYELPGQTVTSHFITEMPLRSSSLRSLGAYANVFAIESFIDELAVRAGADPLEYRLRYLTDTRARDVLLKAAESFGWDRWKPKTNTGRGIAFARYKNLAAYLAVAMEAQLDHATGAIAVKRVSAAVDVGEAINPDGVANQIEGGIIQSLSWTLKEAVEFKGNEVKSIDWATYPILHFSEVPEIEVHVIDRPGFPFLGTGEASQGPAAAALANALADVAEMRFTETPFTPPRIKAALAGNRHV
jgi:CO/xanthine dehydrogenase Mo-binding subunit